MTPSSLSLTILLVSDIHLYTHHIPDLVAPWVRSQGIDVDVILCSGDLCNLKGEQYNDADAIAQAERDIDGMLFELEKICKRVYYIPGNHDPMSTFLHQEQRSPSSTSARNVHNQVVDLVDDSSLRLVGFGGSVPAFVRDTGDLKWEGYPFKNEHDFRKEFNELMQTRVLLEHGVGSSDDNRQMILMTHVGPSGSDTALYQDSIDSPAVLSGSDTLRDFLYRRDSQDSVIANIHGHTHPAPGSSMCCSIPVVNPGSLKEGRFGVLVVSRSETTRRWAVTERRFVNIDC